MQAKFPIILASQSPRRKELLEKMGLSFQVQVQETPEDFPSEMPAIKVAEYLAAKKAQAFQGLPSDHILITADTVVVVDDEVLNKPANEAEAIAMLNKLSGKTHQVVSGVCIRHNEKIDHFSDITEVSFNRLTEAEIHYYIKHFQPFDKAGAYGIQEWIGLIGVHKLNGSYFTVMGLPIHLIYEHLKDWAIDLG